MNIASVETIVFIFIAMACIAVLVAEVRGRKAQASIRIRPGAFGAALSERSCKSDVLLRPLLTPGQGQDDDWEILADGLSEATPMSMNALTDWHEVRRQFLDVLARSVRQDLVASMGLYPPSIAPRRMQDLATWRLVQTLEAHVRPLDADPRRWRNHDRETASNEPASGENSMSDVAYFAAAAADSVVAAGLSADPLDPLEHILESIEHVHHGVEHLHHLTPFQEYAQAFLAASAGSGMSEDQLQEAIVHAHDSVSEMASELATPSLHLPIITLLTVSIIETRLAASGKTTVGRAVKNTVVKTTAVGGGMAGGKFIGALVGMPFGPPGMIVGGILGGLAGAALGAGVAKDVKLEPLRQAKATLERADAHYKATLKGELSRVSSSLDRALQANNLELTDAIYRLVEEVEFHSANGAQVGEVFRSIIAEDALRNADFSSVVRSALTETRADLERQARRSRHWAAISPSARKRRHRFLAEIESWNTAAHATTRIAEDLDLIAVVPDNDVVIQRLCVDFVKLRVDFFWDALNKTLRIASKGIEHRKHFDERLANERRRLRAITQAALETPVRLQTGAIELFCREWSAAGNDAHEVDAPVAARRAIAAVQG